MKIILLLTLSAIMVTGDEELRPTHKTIITQASAANETYVAKTIYDVCKKFVISAANCSCKLFTIKGNSIFPDLCAFHKYIQEPTLTLTYSPALSGTYAFITVFASLIGIVGNMAVILVAYKKRKHLSKCKKLIAQLSVSDLVFAVFQFIVAFTCFWTNKWLYGLFMCKLLRSGIMIGGLLTVGFILIIAIERYYAVIQPLGKGLSPFKLNLYVAANAVMAIATVIPLLVVLQIDRHGRCSEQWPIVNRDSDIYSMFLLSFYFIIPVAIISFLYVKIILHLHRGNTTCVINNKEAMTRRIQENKRAMCILISILIAFIICILPNRVVWVYLDAVDLKVDYNVYMTLSYIGLVTYPLHVAVNPIIYSIIDRRWRQDIIKVFTCKSHMLPSTSGSCSSMRTKSSTDDTVISKTSFGQMFQNLTTKKGEERGRSSVDYATHLLGNNSTQFSMQITELNTKVDDNTN